MSLSATLALAAAATSASAQDAQLPRGAEFAQAQVMAQILPAAIVRQASGPEPVGDSGPGHQLSRRGNTVLVEYQ